MTQHYDHPDLKALHAALAGRVRKRDPQIDQATFEKIVSADHSVDVAPAQMRLIPDAGFVQASNGFATTGASPNLWAGLRSLRRLVIG